MPHEPISDADQSILAAVVRMNVGDPAGADTLLRAALARTPDNLMLLTKLAEVEVTRKDHVGAIAHLTAVLRREPNFAPALTLLAHASWIAGRPREGLSHARRTLEIQPHNALNHLMVAQLCVWLGLHAEAERELRPLLEDMSREPEIRAGAYATLADLEIARGDYAGGTAALRRAIEIAPALASAHMQLGMNLLRLGVFAEGWAEYECRELVPSFHPNGHPSPPGQTWRGESLRGRVILVVDDQGNGDAFQMFRYVHLLRRQAPARIVWRTFSPLQRLLAASAPFAEVVTATAPDFVPDFSCMSSSLPLRFATDLASMPSEVPYLHAPVDGRNERVRLPSGRGRKVGLVWSGDHRHLRDNLRSIPAERFLRLTDTRGVRFFSLQNVVRDSDKPALAAYRAVDRVGEQFEDFAETAAVVAQLDLVIAVDTAVAHLAGAMGKPLWILLPFPADWRWMTEREDCPWYPTARLFRSGPEGWGPALRRVTAALRAFAKVS